jgi:DNA-directed RNA polymerase specialized sigma subunit
MTMGANRQSFDISNLLDKRSYRVYRLRIEQNKTFREIEAIMGLSRNRFHQIYQASVQRIELKKRGGDV